MPRASDKIINLLIEAYHAELETVMNYIANSVNLDGVRAEPIKAALLADVTAELGHAQTLARRIKTIGGAVPGSKTFKWTQKSLQPPARAKNPVRDLIAVIKGVIDAEESAIDTYNRIIKASEGKDYVTQDIAITILADEEEHRREFVSFLREFEEG